MQHYSTICILPAFSSSHMCFSSACFLRMEDEVDKDEEAKFGIPVFYIQKPKTERFNKGKNSLEDS